ncbi:D-alanyl-D-alanine carboxypeptidase family protein [Enterococcus timonensis]|uniref:D-alanyl-D-alanine carboxypeptidase family protein n=1 Tax=Enterococcus timonensis TaxID=1852364 RepID=UPI0008D9DFEE|nr:D-alanyl-D-alanine carboxypeptidase family protein [Enterococcus timonensis]
MKLKNKLGLLLMTAATIFVSLTATVQPVSADDLNLDVKSAIAIDADSGKIFYEQDADEVLGIASMTKLVSIYVLLDAVAAGTVTWDDPVEIPAYLIPLSQNFDLSNVPLYDHVTYTVKDLYEASLIASANAAVIALGVHVAGSEAEFVPLMQNKLTKIGITDATIVNASGLNNSYLGENIVPGTAADAENYMSARDMAILARHLLKDYPEILETTSITNKVFAENTSMPFEMTSWNYMLPGFVNEKAGVDGLKTGTTDIAGACFTGTMTYNGTRMITVVMHANDHENNPSARFNETSKLMDYVTAHWSQTVIDPATFQLPQTSLPVETGEEETVALTMEDASSQTLWIKDGIAPEVTSNLNDAITAENGKMPAPVSQNVKVGNFTITPSDDLGYIESADAPKTDIAIVTKTAVEKAGIWQRMTSAVKNFFASIGNFFSNLFTIVPLT